MLARQEFNMAPRNQIAQIKNLPLTLVFLVLLTVAFVFPTQAYALGQTAAVPSLPDFVASVVDGNANALRGIYVPGVMAFPIIQQPMGNPGYVSSTESTVTQFSIASEVGNIGLLAHNYLAGAGFFQLTPGTIITLVYGNGQTQSFMIVDVQRYQALSPLSPYSNFRDVETETVFTAEQLFNHVYRGDFHLTLQTCIEQDGNLSWGRLFVIATPVAVKSLDQLSSLHQNLFPN